MRFRSIHCLLALAAVLAWVPCAGYPAAHGEEALPQLHLAGQRSKSGDLEAELEVNDPNLKPDTLLLEYQATGFGERWHTVAIDPIPADAGGPAHRGQIAWRPEKDSPSYVVRAR